VRRIVGYRFVAVNFAALFSLWTLFADATASASAIATCADGSVLVERDHYDDVAHVCLDLRGKHCFAFERGVSTPKEPRDHVRVCVDRYEAPNIKGARPIVMLSGNEAGAWCASKSKRLCTEGEWETACEGPELKPWVYGWKADGTICNSGKNWMQFDERALASNDVAVRTRESDRLWQGEVSGSRAQCVSAEGVYDLIGNVEEWVTARASRHFKKALMGGFWAKPWTGCRGTNDAHDPSFRFYEVGFRCCSDPR
jgi:sulfatase modifying factor 1